MDPDAFQSEKKAKSRSTRAYSTRGTKGTFQGKRPPVSIVKYAEFTKDPGVPSCGLANCFIGVALTFGVCLVWFCVFVLFNF